MGALLGVVLSCLYGPKVISWWFEPPVDVGYNCRPATDWAMKRLMLVQIASLLLGALLATGILKVFKKREE